MSATSYNPGTTTDGQPMLLVCDWSLFDQDQKRWPIPGPPLLFAFFLMGAIAPRYFGSLGISALFLVAAIFPSRYLVRFMKKGDVINLFSIITGAMMVGNFDAIGDLMGSETFRFSWVLLGMAALLLPFQFNRLKNEALFCVLIMGVVVAFQILTAVGKTSVLRAIEINGSYMAAFLILLAAMVKRETRDALAWQLSLVAMVNCGFCLFEMLFPMADVSISSSQAFGEVKRSAGIYANAITSGLMVSAMLLFATMASTKSFASRKEKLAMVTLTALTGIGVVVTFSRAAALAFFLVGMLVAFRLANNRFNKLAGYLPVVFLVIIVSFIGTGEYLSAHGGLSTDATKRYDMVKETLTGNLNPIFETLEFRARAWGPTRPYWQHPKIMGQGYNFVSEKGFYPPHNMVILILVETGWLGLLFFGFLLVFMVGPGTWSMNFKNFMLIMSILLPIALIVVESHSFFTRRYFALHAVLLVFTTRILLNPKKVQR
jgi:hypothetical protein